MIAIIDYGAGNLQSVKKALDFIGAQNIISSDCAEIESADAVILPGVGSFGDAAQCLRSSGLEEAVKAFALSKKPFLGICLGLHLLFERSEESPEAKGLGLLKGEIKRFPNDLGLKIPHIGWNSIDIKNGGKLFSDVPQNSYVYFVHSYYLNAENENEVGTQTNYGIDFHSAVSVPEINLYATQFHPEKSGEVGLRILRNFAEMQGVE